MESSLPHPAPAPPDTPARRVCEWCGRRCHIAVASSMPRRVVVAYGVAGVTSMATCREGSAAEQTRLGASYDDVIAERIECLKMSSRGPAS